MCFVRQLLGLYGLGHMVRTGCEVKKVYLSLSLIPIQAYNFFIAAQQYCCVSDFGL